MGEDALSPERRLPIGGDPWAERDRVPGVRHVIAAGAVLVGLEDGARRVRMTDQRQIEAVLAGSGMARPGRLGRGPAAEYRRCTVFPRPVHRPDAGVDGAVVVTTPPRLASLEAEKAIEMFGKLNVPVLGVVENMSFAVCDCGRWFHPFGKGGGDAVHRATRCAILGQVPFEETTAASGHAGAPAMINRQGETAASFRAIAEQVPEALGMIREGAW
jgi:hypothetical protein